MTQEEVDGYVLAFREQILNAHRNHPKGQLRLRCPYTGEILHIDFAEDGEPYGHQEQ